MPPENKLRDLQLESDGLTIEQAELPNLPATMAMVMNDPRRSLKVQPYQHWLEKSLETDTIVVDKETLRIKVTDNGKQK